jgi:hypothetical protein
MSKKGKRHPIKGAFGGLFLGLGLVLGAFIFSISPVKTFTPYYIIIGACVVLGVLWGIFGPARRRKSKAKAAAAAKQPAPVGVSAPPAAAPATAAPPAPAPGAPPAPPAPAPEAHTAPPPTGPPTGPSSGLPPA